MTRVRVLHVFDSTLAWDQRLALAQLSDRLPAEQFEQHVVLVGARQGEAAHIAAPVEQIPRRLTWDWFAGPSVRRDIERHKADLLHAWGRPALRVALAADRAQIPILAALFDPAEADAYARLLRLRPERSPTAVLCATEIVRRRLLEHGHDPAEAVLVRPGVDFATLNRARQSDLRARLGLGAEAAVLLTNPPATRDGGQFCAFWAAAVRSFLEPQLRLIVPGAGREVARLRRLAAAVEMSDLLVTPGAAWRFEDLVGVADSLLLPGALEASVTAAAWAMAAGVPIVASATRAVAELLAHDHNAFLIKPDITKRLAMRFAAALARRHEWQKYAEVARGQAYEVFSVRRCVEQVQQVYENLLAGRTPAEGVKDPAIAG